MNIISFDTETGGLDWFNEDEGPFIITWSDAEHDYVAHVDNFVAMAQFRQALLDADLLVAHNLPFDYLQLLRHCGIDVPLHKAIDTNILARVVCPERRVKLDDDVEGSTGFKLKDLATTYVDPDAKDSEDEMKALARSAKIRLRAKGGYLYTWRAYPEAVEDYAKMDTRLTYGLYQALKPKLTEQHQRIWQLEQAVQPHLIRASWRGVAIDQSKVTPLRDRYVAERDEAYARLLEAEVGQALGDPNDPEDKDNAAELRDALLEAGVPLYRKVKSCKHGDAQCECALATNHYALQEFEADFPVITDLFTYRRASKFLATYIEPMVDRDEVHPSFHQIGAWTGRMSASRPNMQNIPVRGEGSSELREMFVPRPGHCFLVSDYDSIEPRLLAYYLGSRGAPYRALIAEGHDNYAWLAAMVWGGQMEDYLKGTDGEKRRTVAKEVQLAITYGAGAPRVADILQRAGMPSTKEAARQLISAVKASIPGFHHLSDRIKVKVKTSGHVNTIMGRYQPVRRDKAYIGMNALIQGSAADIFKQGIINVAKAVAPYGAVPVLFVHDEIGTECPIEHAEEALAAQEAAMRAAFNLDPELLVSSSICYNNYAEGK